MKKLSTYTPNTEVIRAQRLQLNPPKLITGYPANHELTYVALAAPSNAQNNHVDNI